MTRDTEQPVIFLHQVKVGDLFYNAPSEIRAWIRGPADGARLQPAEVPVRRGGRSTHVNRMARVRVRANRTDR
jgi:hypothetical protein